LNSRSFTCAVNALAGLGGTSLIVRSVTIPAARSGWTKTTSPGGTVGAGGAVTISSNQTLAAGQSWSFTITLSPSCMAPATAGWAITSQVANTNGTLTGPNVAGPAATISATATGMPTVSVNVVSSSLQWAFSYSYDDQSGSGSIVYRVTGAGCSGWNVSVAAKPFTYTGPGKGRTIPVSSLSLTSIGAPPAISGSGSGVVAATSTGGLGSSQKVLSAQTGTGNGTYEQNLGVSLIVPGRANVGSYRSTITITTAAGP
jgi:hypothetical protein